MRGSRAWDRNHDCEACREDIATLQDQRAGEHEAAGLPVPAINDHEDLIDNINHHDVNH